MNFRFFVFCVEFCIFLRIFDEILSGSRDKFKRRVTCVKPKPAGREGRLFRCVAGVGRRSKPLRTDCRVFLAAFPILSVDFLGQVGARALTEKIQHVCGAMA